MCYDFIDFVQRTIEMILFLFHVVFFLSFFFFLEMTRRQRTSGSEMSNLRNVVVEASIRGLSTAGRGPIIVRGYRPSDISISLIRMLHD